MQRILVLGSGGSGKSTVAKEIGQRLNLPVIHLDRLFWLPGWREHDPQLWPQTVIEACQGQRWVMDGNYSSTLPDRLALADTVVFLDLPRWFCVLNVVLRSIHHLGRERDDLGDGLLDRPDWDFIRWVWDYPHRSRGKVLEMVKQHGSHCRVQMLSSWRESGAWLASLNGDSSVPENAN